MIPNTKMRLNTAAKPSTKEDLDFPIVDDDGNFFPPVDGVGPIQPPLGFPEDPDYGPPVVPYDPTNPENPPPTDGPGVPTGALSWIQQLARMFGLGGSNGGDGGGGGNGGLMNLLAMLGLGGGAALNYGNTREATQAMLDANNNATSFLREQMGAGDQRMLPYTDQGREAVWNMNAMGARPLAGRYQPLGSGRGMVPLSTLAKGK